MDYTRSDAFEIDPGSGNRMHQDHAPIPTLVSAKDMNSVIWSLMEIINDAGLTPAEFDPQNPATFRVLAQAVNTYLPAFAGAQRRSIADKLSDIVSVLDGGPVEPGGDATAALLNIIEHFDHVTIDLGNRAYTITDVQVPPGKAVTVRNGKLAVVGETSRGIQRVTTISPQDDGPPSKFDVILDNIKFTRAEPGGACAYYNSAWQDSTGGIVTTPSCSFNLSNGAVGLRLARSFGNNIKGKFFMDATSTGVLADASEVVEGDAHPSGPMETVVDEAMFTGGIAFDCAFNAESNWNAFEGFSFGAGVRFYSSKFKATKYNGLKLTGCHGASASAILDSGINTAITGGYYDRRTGGDKLFTFKTTVRDMQGVTIDGGVVLSAQGAEGDLVVFSDAGAAVGKQITNVNLGGFYAVGGVNSSDHMIRGVVFDHANCSHVNIDGGPNFQAMFACLAFDKPINRSTIKAFEARDVSWYAQNVETGWSGGYNRFDPIYRFYENFTMVYPTYISTAVVEPIGTTFCPHPEMMRPPAIRMGAYLNQYGPHFTFQVTSLRNGISVELIKAISAPGGTRAGQTAHLTLDASQYIAPL